MVLADSTSSRCRSLMPGEVGTQILRYVARQPILDRGGKIYGYELLFREGLTNSFSGNGEVASKIMLDNALLFGLDKLSGGLPAFFNCTADTLTGSLARVLPAGMVVLEILETVTPTPELIACCQRLREEGFRMAMDDFVYRPELLPLLQLCDFIKIDFLLSNKDERRVLFELLGPLSQTLIAEKIENAEQYEQACKEGFKLFQGFYFCRPVLIEGHEIPSNRISQLKILQLLHSDPLDLHAVSDLVKRDASLTYRLLRLVNSPVCAMRQEVRSVESALMVIGEDAFRRLATLAITSEINNHQSPALLRMAFERARFCESLADHNGLDPDEQYLLGLLSLLPAMLHIAMEELVQALPLRSAIKQALLGDNVAERMLLDWLEAHERGKWRRCDELMQFYRLQSYQLLEAYTNAVTWAETALKAVD